MSIKGAAACWLVAGVAYSALEATAASAVPGYGYADDMISDLGRPDSPLSHLMNAAFVVQGTLFLAGAILLVRGVGKGGARAFIAFAAANAIGNAVVAAVPSGSAGIAWVHVGAATLAIVGGNAAILVGAPVAVAAGAPPLYRVASTALAALGLLSFVLLAIATTTTVRALSDAVSERASVYTIIAWQVMSAVVLLGRRRSGRAPLTGP